MKIDARPSRSSPAQRYVQSSRTQNIPIMHSTTSAVQTPVARSRRPLRSALCPSTGAITAISSPAAAVDQASQLFADTSPGRSAPTASVRYTENTNVRATCWKPDDPQSHSPHAHTRDRRGPASGSTAAVTGRAYRRTPDPASV